MNGDRPLAPDATLDDRDARLRPAEADPRVDAASDVELRYPGVWLRDDVWATHGHYMDWHNTVPTIERLAIGLAERIVGPGRDGRERMTVEEYEAALAPVYQLAYTLAQSSTPGRQLAGGGRSADAWERLNGTRPGRRARVEKRVAGVAVPAAVGMLNKLGIGPLSPDLSAIALRTAGLGSMRAVVAALGIDAPLRRLRPHPPQRPLGARRRVRVGAPERRPPDQQRQLGRRADLPGARADRVALLPERDRLGRRRAGHAAAPRASATTTSRASDR